MPLHYFKDKSWKQITREERFFCAVLYFKIENRPKEFVEWLIKQKHCKLPIDLTNSTWEVGYEVCLYRDWVKEYGWQGENSINKTDFRALKKRTFDLCFFSEGNIILIEAKANCGYDRTQLPIFEKEKEQVAKLFGKEEDEIFLVSIHSSKYNPKESTKKVFSGYIHWNDLISTEFHDDTFKRANECYRD
ncbi:MAG: hypothetical protein IPN68_16750 [Bacteroidetes bacterium]|nr:hypothetical protein [Bacteroidota bacterium]